MMPLVGFLPANDDRVEGTIRAIQKDLQRDGFVARYDNDPDVEGVTGTEGAFLPCSFWLADCLALLGERAERRERSSGRCSTSATTSGSWPRSTTRPSGA